MCNYFLNKESRLERSLRLCFREFVTGLTFYEGAAIGFAPNLLGLCIVVAKFGNSDYGGGWSWLDARFTRLVY